MNNIPKITDAEWEVMQVLWNSSPCTSSQVIDTLSHSTEWKPNTVKTLLTRLVTKGAATVEKQGRENLYYAQVTEAQCLKVRSKSLFSRVRGSTLMPTLVQFLQKEKLSSDEINKLRRILDDMEKKSDD